MSDLPSIPMLITNELVEVLAGHGIDPHDYRPAYDGKSVGLDLYNIGPTIYIPPGTTNFREDWAFGDPEPDEKVVKDQFGKIFKQRISTGLLLALPNHWAGIIQERGSITKHPLKIRAGVVDPEYTGQVFVNCVNLSSHPWEIEHGSKLPFQLVVLQANTNFAPVTQEEYESLTEGSTRKGGMIGSSDA